MRWPCSDPRASARASSVLARALPTEAGMGSLALSRGLLLVGDQAKTARVRCFDQGGRELALGFSFRDPVAGRSAAAGLAVDEDRTILVADTPADRVRRFSFFGREVGGIGGATPGTSGPEP